MKTHIKLLSPSIKRDIELRNHARRLGNLPPIKITVHQCAICGRLFESAGNRTCGCQIEK